MNPGRYLLVQGVHLTVFGLLHEMGQELGCSTREGKQGPWVTPAGHGPYQLTYRGGVGSGDRLLQGSGVGELGQVQRQPRKSRGRLRRSRERLSTALVGRSRRPWPELK